METTYIHFKDGRFYELIAGYPLMRQWYPSSEPETRDWMVDHIKPDWVCLDLGAHVGVYTMLLSLLAPDGYVFAFEPCQKSREMLAANLAHNDGKWGHHFKNVHVSPMAVGNRSGKNIHETLWLTDGTESYGKTDGDFHMITLDDFCHNVVERLDFIKCDVDGWDYEVLLGAEQTLLKFRPYLIVEVNYALGWRKHNYTEVDEFLHKVHYQHKLIDPTPGQWLCWPEEKSGG